MFSIVDTELIADTGNLNGVGSHVFRVPAEYQHLCILAIGQQSSTSGGQIFFNGDETGANYWETIGHTGNNVTQYRFNYPDIQGFDPIQHTYIYFWIPFVSETGIRKTCHFTRVNERNMATHGLTMWDQATSLTDIKIHLNGDTWKNGSRMQLRGVKSHPLGPTLPEGKSWQPGRRVGLRSNKLIYQRVLSSPDVFNPTSLDQSFSHLYIWCKARSAEAITDTDIRLRYNNDANGSQMQAYTFNGDASHVHGQGFSDHMNFGHISGASATAGIFGYSILFIPFYSYSFAFQRGGRMQSWLYRNNTTHHRLDLGYTHKNLTVPVTSLYLWALGAAPGNLAAGSEIRVYGIV